MIFLKNLIFLILIMLTLTLAGCDKDSSNGDKICYQLMNYVNENWNNDYDIPFNMMFDVERQINDDVSYHNHFIVVSDFSKMPSVYGGFVSSAPFLNIQSVVAEDFFDHRVMVVILLHSPSVMWIQGISIAEQDSQLNIVLKGHQVPLPAIDTRVLVVEFLRTDIEVYSNIIVEMDNVLAPRPRNIAPSYWNHNYGIPFYYFHTDLQLRLEGSSIGDYGFITVKNFDQFPAVYFNNWPIYQFYVYDYFNYRSLIIIYVHGISESTPVEISIEIINDNLVIIFNVAASLSDSDDQLILEVEFMQHDLQRFTNINVIFNFSE